MTILFWCGLVVFLCGFIMRYIVRFKYYRNYRQSSHTDLQKQEMSTRYRPLIFIGLVIEGVGCIITFISLL